MTTQWIRSAFWIGKTKPDQEEAFRQLMDGTLIPSLRALPGVSDARALWSKTLEDNPPDVLCQVLVEFASRDDVDRMLASPQRSEMRPGVLAAREMFAGSFSHIEYEVGRRA